MTQITSDDIDHQRAWSDETFGPGERAKGVVKHIGKELAEIEADPSDIKEWVDVIILAIDGATRQGHSGTDLLDAYHAKMQENQQREWPDWRLFSEDEPIEHVRASERRMLCFAPEGCGEQAYCAEAGECLRDGEHLERGSE